MYLVQLSRVSRTRTRTTSSSSVTSPSWETCLKCNKPSRKPPSRPHKSCELFSLYLLLITLTYRVRLCTLFLCYEPNRKRMGVESIGNCTI